MPHPAADIIRTALTKLRKTASSRKYVKLTQECKALSDNLDTVLLYAHEASVPPPASVHASASSSTGASKSDTLQQHPDGRTPSVTEHLPDGRTPSVTGAVASGQAGGETAAEAEPDAPEDDTPPSEDGDDEEEQSSSAAAAVPEGAAAASSDTPDTGAVAPVAGETAAGNGAAVAAADAARVAVSDFVEETGLHHSESKQSLSGEPTHAPAAVEPGPQKTRDALADSSCTAIMKVMRLAVETAKPQVVEVALDCIQKLLAFKFLQGVVYSIQLDRGAKDGDGADFKPAATSDPGALAPQAVAVELICRSDEIPDEAVELHILKALLTATTSPTFLVHGQALLLAVRTCYNIFLTSRSEVNQTTAKATLTQMLNVVFQRMEANSVGVTIKPIMVSDVLSTSSAAPQDTSLASTVQAIIDNVVSTTAGSVLPMEDVRRSIAGAFETPGHRPSTPSVGGSSEPGQSHHGAEGHAAGTPPARKAGEDGHASLLHKDAFLVFRALCKLSIRTSDSNADPTSIRGKVLALELLKIVMENSGVVFQRSEKFVSAIRQYLCLSLLKNGASSNLAALQLSASIFLTIMCKFRQALKAEIGVFFPMIILKSLEPLPPPGVGQQAPTTPPLTHTFAYRSTVLRCLREMCKDGQLLVDLFVNYDCDLEGSNLFDRTFNALVKMAQTSSGPQADPSTGQSEQFMRQEALHCLVNAMEALLKWYRKAGEAEERNSNADSEASMAVAHTMLSQTAAALETASLSSSAPEEEKGGDALSKKRADKLKFQEGLALFNKKPKKGIELLQQERLLGRSPEAVATFLKNTEGLDKTLIGDYLGERDETNLKVMHAYVDFMNFESMNFDDAIRHFLSRFRLPGEAQKIDRLMQKFAERYVKCNAGSFKSADVAYVLAYSVIMLNTDAHNPQVKVKMTKEGFLKNNRGINDGSDMPVEFMTSLYDRIVNNEIKMRDDNMLPAAQQNQQKGFAATLLQLLGGARHSKNDEPSDEAIKRTLDNLHQKAKGVTFFESTDGDTIKPILDVIWAPLLGALSVLFEEYSDPRLVRLCLSGLSAGAMLTAMLGMNNLRDLFVSSLCNFTHLHSPSSMHVKHMLAFKALLQVGEQVGDHLQERWLDVLRCVSRWELLQQMASGVPTDAALFAMHPPQEKGMRAVAAAMQQRLRQLGVGGRHEHDGELKSIDSLSMNELSVKRVQIGGGGEFGKLGKPEERGGLPADVLSAVDYSEVSRIFVNSSNLDSDAIVYFVRALTSISADELKSTQAPRVFSLTKIVEIAHFNMGRIRLVWSRIWAVLSDYFITVGCHHNLSVAMYAVDSLRQLAMKFLEEKELLNFTFQNDFLRPFVVVMRQSQAVEIRELILRCLSQMVLARVMNVKSGWQSMFMVFTTAAGDKDATIVRLAFDAVERIVREHFKHITETETTVFTDCVNCLIAFTNNKHSLDVALLAIAFLRFCAQKLAEGAIGKLEKAGEENGDSEPATSPAVPAGTTRIVALDREDSSSSAMAAAAAAALASSNSEHDLNREDRGEASTSAASNHKFQDVEEHIYFWFPLLAGLSELTFDPTLQIRDSAREVLFDVLKEHGAAFAQSFWLRIFDSVLLPIFDHVRAEVTDTTTFTTEHKREKEDAWLYDTCQKCLNKLVDLMVQFYDTVSPVVPRLLELLQQLMQRTHYSLAQVGVAGYAYFVRQAGPLMDEPSWVNVLGVLMTTIEDTKPNAQELITPPPRPAGAPAELAGPRTYSLREGVGARRLIKFRCKKEVQLLLVQHMGDIYLHQHANLSARASCMLLDALESIGAHSRSIDMDMDLRTRLAAQQLEDRVQEMRLITDPPLLRLETDAAQAYLSMLLHMFGRTDRPDIKELCNVEDRITRLCLGALERFSLGVNAETKHEPSPLPKGGRPQIDVVATSQERHSGLASPAYEYVSYSVLVSSTLRAMGSLEDAVFKRHLKEFFPVLSKLIRCNYAAPDVQAALSDLFLNRVGPLLQISGMPSAV